MCSSSKLSVMNNQKTLPCVVNARKPQWTGQKDKREEGEENTVEKVEKIATGHEIIDEELLIFGTVVGSQGHNIGVIIELTDGLHALLEQFLYCP